MIELELHAEGVLLPVRVHAGARRNGVQGVQDGMLKVSVTQAPEKGKANKAIVEVLGKALKVRKTQIEIVSGETSPRKRILVRGVSLEELRFALDAAIQKQAK